MPKIAPGISKTVYPFDYNKNNPMEGFNDWTIHVKNQLQYTSPFELCLLEAKKILYSKLKIK
jgi:hypothetical protein